MTRENFLASRDTFGGNNSRESSSSESNHKNITFDTMKMLYIPTSEPTSNSQFLEVLLKINTKVYNLCKKIFTFHF